MGIRQFARKLLKEQGFRRVEKVYVPEARESEKLAGRLALVTGGNSGIGLEIARRFAAAGCCVVIAGSDEGKVQRALRIIGGEEVKGLVLDVRDVGSMPDKVKAAADLFPDLPGVDILVNSAGVSRSIRIGDVREEDWDAVVDVNLKGAFFMTQAAACHMVERGLSGNILNISSSSALRPAWGPYEVSKWGIKGLTLGSADVYVSRGITVNAIGPGPTATAMLGRDGAENLSHLPNPSKRLVTPEEIGDLAVTLVGDVGKMVVGDTLYVGGGAGTICIDR